MWRALTSLSLAVWIGCAPLTPPTQRAGSAGGQGPADTRAPAGPTALDLYLQGRGAAPPAGGLPYAAVLPMVDRSGFRRGVWDIERDVPRLLSARLAAASGWQVVPFDAVLEVAAAAKNVDRQGALAVGTALQCDLVLVGTIVDYNMERLSVGDPLLGGYKSYKGTAALEVQVVRVHDGAELGVLDSHQQDVERDVGLDLLGKPREQDLQFTGLASMPFGSEEFRATALGHATVSAVDEIVGKLRDLLQPAASRTGQTEGVLLSVTGQEGYIDLGSENGVRPGLRFSVYGVAADTVRQAVGVVEVLDVIGGRLSRVRVLDARERLQPGDPVAPMASPQ